LRLWPHPLRVLRAGEAHGELPLPRLPARERQCLFADRRHGTRCGSRDPGRPASYEKPADSGSIARREFCAHCGTPLFASSSASPQQLGMDAAVPKFEKGRPRP